MIGTRTLRASRWGRKFLAVMNMVGSQSMRLVFSLHRGPAAVNGFKMYLCQRAGPSPSFAAALLGGKYEQGTKQLLERLIQKGNTIVDVGAHVGYYALLFARWAGPQGRVFAFEPGPDNYALLRKNVELNGCTNVACIPKAVSDRSAIVQLFVSSQGNDRHSLFENTRSVVHESSCEVSAVSLDQFLEDEGWPRVDLVKMDVEGAEPLVLEGMRETVHRFPGLKLVVELAPEVLRSGGRNPVAFLGRLWALGFRISSIEDGGGLRAWDGTHLPDLVDKAERDGVVNLFCGTPE